MENFKSIYEFNVKVGSDAETAKEYKFAIKRPSRAERDEAGLVQSSYLNKYIRRGVLPEAILSKVYKDQGGILDEEQKMLLVLSELKLNQKREEYKLASVNDKSNTALLENLLREITSLQREITSIYYQEASFFQETAEFKAKNKLIQHYIGILLYWKENQDSEWKRFFKGNDVEEVLDEAEKLEESGSELFTKARDKALFAINYAVNNGFIVKENEVKVAANENGYGE